jgi:uncharacterized protein YkwD
VGSIALRRLLVGAALGVVILGASSSAVMFSGGSSEDGEGARLQSARSTREAPVSSSTTTPTTTPTTTTSTTTTALSPPPPVAEAPPPPPSPPPPPAPEPEPAPSAVAFTVSACSGGGGGVAGAVLDAMNGDRAANGLAPMCWNGHLAGHAQSWAQWMADHQSLTHQNLANVMSGSPFSTVGENVLNGPANMSAGAMEGAWMASGTHRANILGPFSAAGVGIAQSADGQWWIAVDFGG